MLKKLDKYDKMILRLLQENASLSNKELAEKIGLAPSSTLLRVKDLKDKNILKQTVGIVDEVMLGYPITTFAKVTISPLNEDTSKRFVDKILSLPQVKECFSITGSGSYLLKIVTKDLQYYQTFIINKIMEAGSIINIETSVVTGIEKSTTAIPIE